MGLQDVGWMWYVSTVTNPVGDADNHWAPVTGIVNTGSGDESLMTDYTPRGDCVDGTRGAGAGEGGACPGNGLDPDGVVDENKKLRAVATYDDRLGTERSSGRPS